MSFQPSFTQWYSLTNLYTGDGLSLDLVNDNGSYSSGALQMAATGAFSGQYWHFESNPPGSTSTYALYTLFLGKGKRLDVYGNDETKPHLADAEDVLGQIWMVLPWADGTYMLTNNYSGSGLSLDVYSDTKQPFLADGADAGQHWHITPQQLQPRGEVVSRNSHDQLADLD